MNKTGLKGNLLLVVAAAIWGFAFVIQDKAAAVISPFALNGTRSLIGTAALFPLILYMSKKTGCPIFEATAKRRRDLLISGSLCGVFLCAAVNFQQFGLMLYPKDAAASGRGGFITALYVILVPVLSLFNKKRAGINVWIGVVLAAAGMYLLCLGDGISGIYLGDIIILTCALGFTLQILCVDRFSSRVDAVKLSALQFFVCGILSLILMFFFEKPQLHDFAVSLKYILYLGIISSGIAYTLQIVGQQMSKNPTVASIIMSLESVFALIGGVIFLGETFTLRESIGCAAMFTAIVISQLPPVRLKKHTA